ncbi:cytochrome c oxidase assembly factor 4 homolog, mitochondrial [Belonocnema kinseyi]|uniref:cytochrome c oxidase assembly factor 4 homolog, mitochondrial n=1 Tax=Belonocnema kinseyi TaxID=2817044 RepID=UPI00143D22BC|nr:cytochrome c oxidase assembly factor 4 homolog, mitochondrial [Belonocnema kinseyi]
MTAPSFENAKEDDDIEDPVDRMLKQTGCMELHYKVQECIAETQDWRKCQEHVQKFRECMEEYQQKKIRKS